MNRKKEQPFRILKQKELEKQILKLENVIKEKKSELLSLKRKNSLLCKCNKWTRIDHLTLVQLLTYQRPYSCTEGDYWHLAGYNWKCPKCGAFNGWSKEEKEDQNRLVPLFDKIEEFKLGL